MLRRGRDRQEELIVEMGKGGERGKIPRAPPLRTSAFNSVYVAISSPPSTRMMLPLIQVRAGSLRATRV